MTMTLRMSYPGSGRVGDAAEDVVEAAALARELLDADLMLTQGGADLRGDAAAVRRPHHQVDHAVDLRHQVDPRHFRQRLQHLDRPLRLARAEPQGDGVVPV